MLRGKPEENTEEKDFEENQIEHIPLDRNHPAQITKHLMATVPGQRERDGSRKTGRPGRLEEDHGGLLPQRESGAVLTLLGNR